HSGRRFDAENAKKRAEPRARQLAPFSRGVRPTQFGTLRAETCGTRGRNPGSVRARPPLFSRFPRVASEFPSSIEALDARKPGKQGTSSGRERATYPMVTSGAADRTRASPSVEVDVLMMGSPFRDGRR